MKPTRRWFLQANLLGGVAAAFPFSTGADSKVAGQASQNPRYARLDEILKEPVLKRDFFSTPIIIESLELLRYKDSFLCRVRSRDGAEGVSVGHSGLNALYPIFTHNLQPFFIGKDARDLDLLLGKFLSTDSISGTTEFPSAYLWPRSSLRSSICSGALRASRSAS